MDLTNLTEIVTAIVLVFSRVGGFMMITPFPGKWVPRKVRVALLITLALTIGMMVPKTNMVPLDLNVLIIAANEFMIGVLIGAAFRFVLAAVEFMAGLISQASWLSAPVSLNPEMGGQSQVLGQVSMLFALLIALGAGVHRIVIGYLMESFHVLPVGRVTSVVGSIMPFVELVGRSFDVGMRLALPVLALSLAVQTSLALISRVAPSLQIFSVGFAVLVATGLVTFMASLRAIGLGIVRYLGILPGFLDELLLRLGGG